MIDQNKKESILHSPVWQFVGVIISLVFGIIGVAVAYDIFFKQENITALEVFILSEESIEVGEHYNIEAVSALTELRVKLENTGNQVIYVSDYAQPIEFEFPLDTKILELTKVESNPPKVNVSSNITGNLAILEPIFFNPQDQVTIRFLIGYTSKKENQLFNINTRIAGVKEIPKVVISENTRLFSNIYLIALLVSIAFILLILLFIVYKTLQRAYQYPILRVDADRKTIERIIEALNNKE